MANQIYLSQMMLNGAAVVHSSAQGQEVVASGSVKIPAGTDLASTDKILLARFPEGTVFSEILVEVPDLDDGAALTLDVGYDRPVENPKLAYNATTNPYTDNAIATADPDFFEAVATTGQAGGVILLQRHADFTVTTPAAVAGDVDVSITPVTGAATASTAGGVINFSIRGYLTDEVQVAGEFSGANALQYTTNYDI